MKFLTGYLTGKPARIKISGLAKKTSDPLLYDEKIIFSIRAIAREQCAAQVGQSFGPPILQMTFEIVTNKNLHFRSPTANWTSMYRPQTFRLSISSWASSASRMSSNLEK